MKEPVSAARKRVTTKGDATREAVKQAAKRCIAVDGFAAVKVATIMAEAHRSAGAFYLYFRSKEVLLHELLEDFRLRLKAEVNRAFDHDVDPLTDLSDHLGAFWRVYRDEWPVATAAFQMSMVDPQFARAWRLVRQQGIRGLTVWITHAKKRGHAAALDTELAASALCSMLEYTCYNWTVRSGDFPDRFIDDRTAVQVLTELVVHGIGGREAIAR
jgi:AcrR family transcriptional regulator